MDGYISVRKAIVRYTGLQILAKTCNAIKTVQLTALKRLSALAILTETAPPPVTSVLTAVTLKNRSYLIRFLRFFTVGKTSDIDQS